MATAVTIKHSSSGLVKKGYYGFSWTYLFFGWFVPLFRGELGVAALHLLFSVVTFGFWQLVLCFLYNKQYMTRMLTNGWVLADSAERNSAAALRLGIAATPAAAAIPAR
jgi:hypothetical protein